MDGLGLEAGEDGAEGGEVLERPELLQMIASSLTADAIPFKAGRANDGNVDPLGNDGGPPLGAVEGRVEGVEDGGLEAAEGGVEEVHRRGDARHRRRLPPAPLPPPPEPGLALPRDQPPK